MTTLSKFIGIALLLLGVLAVAQTGESAPPAPIATPHVGDAVAGKASFTEYCSICHGVGAKGFIGPNIGGINWTVPGLHAIVRAGVGGYGSMPAFNADAVTDTTIADIAAYLASLPSGAAPQPASPSPASTAPSAASLPIAAASASATASATTTATQPIADINHGRAIFSANCAACHGATGQGGIGPNLHGERNRKNLAAAIAWIKNPAPPMPKLYPVALSEKDVDDVAAFIETLEPAASGPL